MLLRPQKTQKESGKIKEKLNSNLFFYLLSFFVFFFCYLAVHRGHTFLFQNNIINHFDNFSELYNFRLFKDALLSFHNPLIREYNLSDHYFSLPNSLFTYFSLLFFSILVPLKTITIFNLTYFVFLLLSYLSSLFVIYRLTKSKAGAIFGAVYFTFSLLNTTEIWLITVNIAGFPLLFYCLWMSYKKHKINYLFLAVLISLINITFNPYYLIYNLIIWCAALILFLSVFLGKILSENKISKILLIKTLISLLFILFSFKVVGYTVNKSLNISKEDKRWETLIHSRQKIGAKEADRTDYLYLFIIPKNQLLAKFAPPSMVTDKPILIYAGFVVPLITLIVFLALIVKNKKLLLHPLVIFSFLIVLFIYAFGGERFKIGDHISINNIFYPFLYKNYNYIFLKYYRNLHWLFFLLALGVGFSIKTILSYFKNNYYKIITLLLIVLFMLFDITSANNTKTLTSSSEDISKIIDKDDKALLLPWKQTGDYYYYYLLLYGVQNDLDFFIRSRDPKLNDWYKKNNCLISLECEQDKIDELINQKNLKQIGVEYLIFHINTQNEKPYNFTSEKIKKIEHIKNKFREKIVYSSNENLILKF